jgi:hypothetical protein
MNIRGNAGYIITDSVHIGETEYVIGVHEKDPNRYVTWACKNGNNYFWGHYITGREAAEKDLVSRAADQIQFLESIRGNINPPKRQDRGMER